MTRQETESLGWDELDVIIVSGDAFVDHPSFGSALLARWLIHHGYRTGIIAQPQSDEDYTRLGRPRLFWGVTSGNVDSMVANYTALKKPRSDDAYTPNGEGGKRPDRATIVYTQAIRRLFKGTTIVLGGIEASLRRVPHYDYWTEKVRNSILPETRADILVYGMGERQIIEIARRVDEERALDGIPGTVVSLLKDAAVEGLRLPTWEESKSPEGYLKLFQAFDNKFRQHTLIQDFAGRKLVHYPPQEPLSEDELDALYRLPFSRKPHVGYKGARIPAFEQIRHSVTAHRGCFGGCSFCALSYHQGRAIRSRSEQSILSEVRDMAGDADFKGTVTDIGGPTANMYGLSCKRGFPADCGRSSCLVPDVCPFLDTSHADYLKLLDRASKIPGIKHLFIASGVRFDLALRDRKFIAELAKRYTGGHLKLAPEHRSPNVLHRMNKPSNEPYDDFCRIFEVESKKSGKKQYVLPYLIAGHPGETLRDTIELALWLHKNNLRVRQIQQFTPTPMTRSTCMYFSGVDPATGEKVHVSRGREVRLMKALLQWYEPQNRKLVIEALRTAGRGDLVGVFTK